MQYHTEGNLFVICSGTFDWPSWGYDTKGFSFGFWVFVLKPRFANFSFVICMLLLYAIRRTYRLKDSHPEVLEAVPEEHRGQIKATPEVRREKRISYKNWGQKM